jgi:hypothetical protein
MGKQILTTPVIALSRVLAIFLSPLIHVDMRRKHKKFLQDVIDQMPWTMSNLRPRVESKETLAMGRYATVTLRCPQYLLQITADFYGGGYDFWTDVMPLSEPHKRARIDVLAKEMGTSTDSTGRYVGPPLLRTLSELDNLIRELDPQLTARLGLHR